MMKISSLPGFGRGLLLGSLLLMLAGCDGGIFGTGDGSLSTSTDLPDSGSPGSLTPESPTDATETPGVQPSDPDDAAQVETRSFENLLTGSNSNLPLISLVNLSSLLLNATTTQADPLFEAGIVPGAVSVDASIALESTELSVFDATTAEPLLVLSPLNLGAFSVSTLIARDPLPGDTAGTADSGSQPLAEIIALPSQRLSGSDGLTRVRLLQASPLDESDQSASMSLVPVGDAPGGSEIDLGTTSAGTFGTAADYRPATPGSYRLVDSLDRLTPVPVELASGEFLTLIIQGSPAELRVLRDSQPADQSASSNQR